MKLMATLLSACLLAFNSASTRAQAIEDKVVGLVFFVVFRVLRVLRG